MVPKNEITRSKQYLRQNADKSRTGGTGQVDLQNL